MILTGGYMNKLFLGLAALGLSLSISAGVKPLEVKSENQQVQTSLTINSPKYAYNSENVWEEEVYTFEDAGGSYTITLKTAEDYELVAVSGSDSMTVNGKYTVEGSKLTLLLKDSVLYEFNINEDGTITLIEPPVENPPVEEPGTEEPGLVEPDYSGLTTAELIEALKEALKESEIDWKKVGSIALALFGGLALSLISLLIYIIRLKLKNIDMVKVSEKFKEEADTKLAEYEKRVEEALKQLDDDVKVSIDKAESKRKEEIEEQSLKLTASIEEAKKNLSINTELE